MSARSGEEPKRKRLKQTSIEESFIRHRSSLNSPYLKGNKETQEIQIMQNTTSSEEELRRKRNLIADAAEKRRGSLCTGTSATSTASSDMVAEGDSKNGISDVEDSPAIEFDDSPLLFPDTPPLAPLPEELPSTGTTPRFVSGGTPLESLNRIPSCLLPLSSLVAQPDHTVLVRPLLSGDFALPPTPSHVNYRDKWDKNHVRMPCSRENLYPGQSSEQKVQNRWELIEATLLGPIKSSIELQEVEEYLSVFWEKTEEEQRAFILDYPFFNKNAMDCGKFFCEYKVNGKTVCQEVWMKTLWHHYLKVL